MTLSFTSPEKDFFFVYFYFGIFFKTAHYSLLELLFIPAVPDTKLCAWGEEDSAEHVRWDTTCRGLCGPQIKDIIITLV